MIYKEWDSRVLGIPVYELEKLSEAPLANDYTYTKFHYNIEYINNLERFGFKLCDISIEYFLDLTKSPAYETYGIRYLDRLDIDRVLEITKNSIYLSRFHKDVNLSLDQADNLYKEWVINACNGTRSDALFVADDSSGVIGFSSCLVKDNHGEIDITAIDINNKDPHVGTNLLAADINYFLSKNLIYAKTSTQLENTPSRNSLKRMGFIELGFIATMSKGRNGKH